MSDIETDEFDRTFCKAHHRETCHECGMSFDIQNRLAEERAGLRKKRTEVEDIADEIATAMSALKGMERMVPRPSEEIFEMNRMYLRNAQEKMNTIDAPKEEKSAALQKAMEEQHKHDIENQALMQAWSKQNPGKRVFEFGGPETQKLYDELVTCPSRKTNRAEKFTCDYCGRSAKDKLLLCARCKKVSYCGKDCQRNAWKAHKKLCIPTASEEKIPKTLHLTWEQVKAHGGSPVEGRTLEVRAILDEGIMRQVFLCKDRAGVIRRVAAYTNSRSIPGLKQGAILRWKNPRYYNFMDGSAGARIEEHDLANVSIL